ncbi:hypothetical protein OTK49_21555 [Vibrio coralliirubri]|uniref:hypothetical protein n=1 Tax=Vibrio coralliirubri TaxID=1516159 RepID=UPI002284EB72|nr:hypothetical protein [Vibrio coralliirubri]MCY9865109.1 hypothetical protein [Vibrio coralliirubri]
MINPELIIQQIDAFNLQAETNAAIKRLNENKILDLFSETITERHGFVFGESRKSEWRTHFSEIKTAASELLDSLPDTEPLLNLRSTQDSRDSFKEQLFTMAGGKEIKQALVVEALFGYRYWINPQPSNIIQGQLLEAIGADPFTFEFKCNCSLCQKPVTTTYNSNLIAQKTLCLNCNTELDITNMEHKSLSERELELSCGNVSLSSKAKHEEILKQINEYMDEVHLLSAKKHKSFNYEPNISGYRVSKVKIESMPIKKLIPISKINKPITKRHLKDVYENFYILLLKMQKFTGEVIALEHSNKVLKPMTFKEALNKTFLDLRIPVSERSEAAASGDIAIAVLTGRDWANSLVKSFLIELGLLNQIDLIADPKQWSTLTAFKLQSFFTEKGAKVDTQKTKEVPMKMDYLNQRAFKNIEFTYDEREMLRRVWVTRGNWVA